MLPLDFDGDIQELLNSVKVLVVGAGGIGCELLKNLVMTGFMNITCLDLDTIEMSNLNRQFLFRKSHVGQSKSKVAVESVREYNPNAHLEAIYGNIKDAQYNVQFYKQFDLVFNALDNMLARQHVNQMCVMSGIPLIESGTTGLLGQSYPIIPRLTECYDCKPHESNRKQYPICTIRSTPEKIEHCIVFGKELFSLLLGHKEDSLLYEESNHTYMPFLSSLLSSSEENVIESIYAFLQGLFHDDIQSRISLGGYKTLLKTPEPISILDHKNVNHHSAIEDYTFRYEYIFTLAETIQTLVTSISLLLKDKTEEITFDKENHLHMCLVTAATNYLRATIFHIPASSYFHIKEIAGNIIPAVASANAIVAGLQVINGIKLLMNRKKDEQGHYQYDRKDFFYSTLSKSKSSQGAIIQSFSMGPPNPSCLTCSVPVVSLVLDIHQATFRGFVEGILKDQLHFESPIVEKDSVIIYESEDSDSDSESESESSKEHTEPYHCDLCKETATNKEAKMHPYFSLPLDQVPNAHIQHCSTIHIEDGLSDRSANIVFYHQPLDSLLPEHEEGFYIQNPEVIAILDANAKSSKSDSDSDSDSDIIEPIEESDDDDIEIVEPVKRVAESEESDLPSKCCH